MQHRRVMLIGGLLLVLLLFPLLAAALRRGGAAPPASPSDAAGPPSRRCPVCGMYVEGYPAWVCRLRLADGGTVWFDGVKDLLRCYFGVERYLAGRQAGEIRGIEVTDYYTLETVDGFKAWYVLGSDVWGPMGRELVPFSAEEAAGEFLRDHHGERVLRFEELTAEVFSQLE